MHLLKHKTLPPPTIIKKMKIFLEMEGKMGPTQPHSANSDPHSLTPTITSERTTQQKKGKEQCPRDSGLQSPSLLLHAFPYQRPHLNPRIKCQTADQFQFVKAPHGLAQARCEGTSLKIGTGCSCQTI